MKLWKRIVATLCVATFMVLISGMPAQAYDTVSDTELSRYQDTTTVESENYIVTTIDEGERFHIVVYDKNADNEILYDFYVGMTEDSRRAESEQVEPRAVDSFFHTFFPTMVIAIILL